jgi:hypothetical protein
MVRKINLAELSLSMKNFCMTGSVDNFFYIAANWDWTEDQAEMQAFIQVP